MHALLLLSSVTVLTAAPADPNGLFAKLDRNQDQRVTADEVSGSQRSYFERALRVSDRNEDGALTADELETALAAPRPVTLSSAGAGGRPGMAGRMNIENLKALDRNGDGEIAIEEVPEPLKPRFQEMMDRVGTKTVSIENLERMLGGNPGVRQQPLNGSTKDGDEMDAEGSSMMRKSDDDSISIEPSKESTDSSTRSKAAGPRARLKSKGKTPPRNKKP